MPNGRRNREKPVSAQGGLVEGVARRLSNGKGISISVRRSKLMHCRRNGVTEMAADKNTGTYEGQIFVDMGDNQMMLHNDPVRCVVGPG